MSVEFSLMYCYHNELHWSDPLFLRLSFTLLILLQRREEQIAQELAEELAAQAEMYLLNL